MSGGVTSWNVNACANSVYSHLERVFGVFVLFGVYHGKSVDNVGWSFIDFPSLKLIVSFPDRRIFWARNCVSKALYLVFQHS